MRNSIAKKSKELFLIALTALLMTTSSQGHAEEPRVFTDKNYVRYEIGTKWATGNFTREDGRCMLNVNIVEASQEGARQGYAPLNVHFTVKEGESAFLNDQEGKIVRFLCNKNAQTMSVWQVNTTRNAEG